MNLVTTEWLAAHPGDVRVVDASWYMPEDKRDPLAEFEAAHIPGAVHFDIDAISDHATGLPHMMPGPGAFSAAAGALGIGDGLLRLSIGLEDPDDLKEDLLGALAAAETPRMRVASR